MTLSERLDREFPGMTGPRSDDRLSTGQPGATTRVEVDHANARYQDDLVRTYRDVLGTVHRERVER